MRRVHLTVVCPPAVRLVDVFADRKTKIRDVARQSLHYFNDRKIQSDSTVFYDGNALDQNLTVKEAGLKQGSVLILNIPGTAPGNSERRR